MNGKAKCKGGTLCKIIEIGNFLAELCKARNTARILALLVWMPCMEAEFILISNDTKNSMKELR